MLKVFGKKSFISLDLIFLHWRENDLLLVINFCLFLRLGDKDVFSSHQGHGFVIDKPLSIFYHNSVFSLHWSKSWIRFI